MREKNPLQWILCSVLLICAVFTLTYFSKTVFAEHPARAIMKLYAKELPDKNTIEPYIISILALNEVENSRHFPEVKEFLLWYISKLNYPDRYGLNGTIYVYVYEEGRARSTDRYDSVDGYAGLFLHLLHRYTAKTGDLTVIQTHWDKIEDIANLIPLMQDRDGLTWAHPQHKAKYLMDNSETYGGLTAYLALRELAGKGHSSRYFLSRHAIKTGIFNELSDSSNNMFAWAVVENKVQSRSSWGTFYPDAFAQLFPLYYDLLLDEPELRQRLWQNFNENYATKIKTFPLEQRIIYQLVRGKMEGN